jgi:hypothetical protein
MPLASLPVSRPERQVKTSILLEKLALLGGRVGLWLSGGAAAASGFAMIVLAVYRSA